ncbi:hypothetical protein FRC17_009942 [Serendipita sp. 399]|nr:hypothetical protein FRC17_009942 [Serendipita sp. 399]
MKYLNPFNWFRERISTSGNFDSGFSSDRSENFTPFRVDDILLEPYTLGRPIELSAIQYPTIQLSMPGAKRQASTGITESNNNRANRMQRLPDATLELPTYQQDVPSERWRTYRKEPIPVGLLPSTKIHGLGRGRVECHTGTSHMQPERYKVLHPMPFMSPVPPTRRSAEDEEAPPSYRPPQRREGKRVEKSRTIELVELA